MELVVAAQAGIRGACGVVLEGVVLLVVPVFVLLLVAVSVA